MTIQICVSPFSMSSHLIRPAVQPARAVLAARAYSALALLGAGGGCFTDEEEGQEGNQEPCSRG
jgi:hypothetical protein